MGTSSCLQCPIGFYANQSGQTVCRNCPAGLSTSIVGASLADDCASCTKGRISTEFGCDVCQPGKYWKETCSSCSPGFYSSENGSLACEPCASGKWNPTTDSTASSSCKPCVVNPGIDCPQGSGVPFVNEGWYRSTDTLDVVLHCFPEAACLQAGLGNTTCRDGYLGIACSECSEKYFRLGERCRACLPDWVRWLMVFATVILFVFICWKLSLFQHRVPLLWRTALYWIQFLGLYGQLSENWPVSLKLVFDTSNLFNFELQYFGLSCQKGVSFWSIWILKMVMPLIFVSCMFCCCFIHFKSKGMSFSRKFSQILATRTGSILYSLTLFSTIIYSSVFEVFNCARQTNGSFVLNKEPSILCYTDSWSRYIAVNYFFVTLYVAVPLLFGIYHFGMIKYGKSIIGENTKVFASPYREGCEYWELTRMFYKLVFIIIRDTSSLDRASKILVLLGVLTAEIYIEVRVLPYSVIQVGQASTR
jgi:hypothetical protein